MSWAMRWFGKKPQLHPEQQARLAAWQALPATALDVPVTKTRCVVVDVETTGLNLMHDRLISIGAVAVVNGKIALGDSFYVVLQQPMASEKSNILLHGIGTTAQLQGEPPTDALLSFLDYLGKDPLIAFHVAFDETMIKRALGEYLGLSFKHPWLDLAYVMPGLNPKLASRLRSLDEWMEHFDIRIAERHNAQADALATAQLLLMSSAQSCGMGIRTYQGLRDLEKAQRWLGAQR